jgi:hypothetical protein
MIEINPQHNSTWLGNGDSRWVEFRHNCASLQEQAAVNNSQRASRLYRSHRITHEIDLAALGLIDRGWVAIPDIIRFEVSVLCNSRTHETMLSLILGNELSFRGYYTGVKYVTRGSWVLEQLEQNNLLYTGTMPL